MSELQSFSNQLVAKTWCQTDVQVVNYSFRWTINNFSFCREKIGEFFRSSTFPADSSKEELKWCLRIYPRGDQMEDKDYISLFLELVSCKEPYVYALYKFSILNAQQEETEVTKVLIPLKFVQGKAFGCKRFVLQSFIFDKTNALLTDDRLTICCEVSVVFDYCNTSGWEGAAVHSKTPGRQPLDDYGNLFESQRLCDVELITDSGQAIPAHKAILSARSPVFAAMFEHDTKEKEQNRVEISGMDPQVLRVMLRCMYTGKASDIVSMPENLLVAADRYALVGLKEMCEEHISSNLSADRAAEVLILADLYCAENLKANVINFIRKAVAVVMTSTGWKSLMQTHPHLIAEVFRAPVTPKLSILS